MLISYYKFKRTLLWHFKAGIVIFVKLNTRWKPKMKTWLGKKNKATECCLDQGALCLDEYIHYISWFLLRYSNFLSMVSFNSKEGLEGIWYYGIMVLFMVPSPP